MRKFVHRHVLRHRLGKTLFVIDRRVVVGLKCDCGAVWLRYPP